MNDYATYPINVGRAADDTDVAFRIVGMGNLSTHTVTLAATTLTIVEGSTTTALDLSTSSYDTIGELMDYINNNLTYTRMVAVASLRAWNTYAAAALNVLTKSSTSLVGTNKIKGVPFYWDTSACGWRSAAISLGEDTTYPPLAAIHAPSNVKMLDATDATDQITGHDHARARLDYISAVGTFGGGGTSEIEITPATQTLDGTTTTVAGAASTTTKTYTKADLLPIYTNWGQRLVVRHIESGQVISSSTLILNGAVEF